jgi:hypothetical protein
MTTKKSVGLFVLALAIVVALSGVMELVGRAVLDKRKELDQSRDFLKDNSRIVGLFGEPVEIEYT